MSWAEEHYGWADEEDFKQTTSKRRRNMTTQTITVAAVTKEPKVWNDETCWGEEHYGWADEEDFKQTTSKRRRNMTTQTITVAAVTKEPKVWNDETCWGVKVGNGWMDLYVKDRPSKG